jgi:hypothetical protein
VFNSRVLIKFIVTIDHHYKNSKSISFHQGDQHSDISKSELFHGDLNIQKDPLLNLIEHKFAVKNTHNHLIFHQNSIIFKLQSLENNVPQMNSFLVKFLEKGSYTMKVEADYKILRKEIYDDFAVLKFNGKIEFEVIVPFDVKYEYN